MKILFAQPDFSTYREATYQMDWLAALERSHQVYVWGPGFPAYGPDQSTADVMALCPWRPDLICYGAGWEWEGDGEGFDLHPPFNPTDLDIPAVMILNKEYKKLERKFAFVREKGIRHVFTSHHLFAEWERILGVPFSWLPFAADPEVFRDHGEEKIHDFGFTGALHATWIDIRVAIKELMAGPEFARVKQFWGPNDGMEVGEAYARQINRARVWLATPSAADLVGPRFYEVLAVGTLLFCTRSSVYGELFEDGRHCVMFEPDLSDFSEKLVYYLDHEDARAAIAAEGRRHALAHHRWDDRVRLFTQTVAPLLGSREGERT